MIPAAPTCCQFNTHKAKEKSKKHNQIFQVFWDYFLTISSWLDFCLLRLFVISLFFICNTKKTKKSLFYNCSFTHQSVHDTMYMYKWSHSQPNLVRLILGCIICSINSKCICMLDPSAFIESYSRCVSPLTWTFTL